uniref:TolC family protein n=1 Tax=Candidatus Stercorousia sp. TaxID=3048886 RepID=UPI0040286FC8
MKKFLISILILLICPSCFAQQELKKISLQEALDIALENNIDYQASKMNVGIAENKVKESNRLQNPEINAFFNIGDIAKGNPQMAGLSEKIEIAKRDARKKLAQSNLELTKQNLEYTEFDLKMDVREAYVNLV